MSPTSGLVTGDAPVVDDVVARQVAADLGDDPPDVVVFAVRRAAHRRAAGRHRAGSTPSCTRTSPGSRPRRPGTATTRPSPRSPTQAVPAILTGRFRPRAPRTAARRRRRREPLHAARWLVRDARRRSRSPACAPARCAPTPPSGGLTTLLGDAVDTWVGATTGGDDSASSTCPARSSGDRYADAEAWEARRCRATPTGPSSGSTTSCCRTHPWFVTDDGGRTTGARASSRPARSAGTDWTDSGVAVGDPAPRPPAPGGGPAARRRPRRPRGRGPLRRRVDRRDRRPRQRVPARAATSGPSPRRTSSRCMWTPLFDQGAGAGRGRGRRPQRDVDRHPADDRPPARDRDAVGGRRRGGRRGPDERRTDDVKFVERNEYNELPSRGGRGRSSSSTTPVSCSSTSSPPTWSRAPGPTAPGAGPSHGGLFGRDVADARGRRARRCRGLGRACSTTSRAPIRPRPLAEVVGGTSLPQGTVVAYALERHRRRRDDGRTRARPTTRGWRSGCSRPASSRTAGTSSRPSSSRARWVPRSLRPIDVAAAD